MAVAEYNAREASRTRTAALSVLASALALGLVLLLVTTEPAGAAFPGKNGKIAFTSSRVTSGNPDGDREIFTTSASGKGTRQLTDNTADDIDPSWSANGKKVAFLTDRDSNDEVYLMNADGSGQKNLTSDPASDSAPAFSPDGRRVVFVSDRTTGDGVVNPTGDQEIFTMKLDGTGLQQLTENEADDDMPVFSPNGKKIAFTTDRDSNDEVYAMAANGNNPVNLSQNPADDGRPDWSPDGKKVVFQTLRDTGSTPEIYTMKASGDDQRRLTRNSVGDNMAVFSPDGKQIAFQSEREGNFEIYRMKLDGSLQTMVTDTTNGGNFIPDWQPLPRR